MLNTPPDLDGIPGSPDTPDTESSSLHDADAQYAFDPLVGGGLAQLKASEGSRGVKETSQLQASDESWHSGVQGTSQLAVVARQVVDIKRLEASTVVELERAKQHGATERTRLVEEGRTQRSACFTAMAKRAMEEYHQTERQKIESTAQVQQAAIAARVAEAEAQAKTPARPMSHWLLLWLCLGQTRKARKVGLPILRVAGFLLVLRGVWSSASSGFPGIQGSPLALLQWAWRALIASLQQRQFRLQPSEQDRLPELPALPALGMMGGSNSQSSSSGNNEVLVEGKKVPSFEKELTDAGLADYLEDLIHLGYDRETLRDLKQGGEVEEMLSAVKCRPEHRSVFLKALQGWQ